MSKNVLVTGAAGFIGSNFVEYFVNKYPDYKVIVLDKLTYAGNLNNLKKVMDKITFVKGDICDFEFVLKVFKKYDINGVIHFAAESHVDNSIKNPFIFTFILNVSKYALAIKSELAFEAEYGLLGLIGDFSVKYPSSFSEP